MSTIIPFDANDYLWMVVLGGITCFTMGFGIGANDVANNIGSAIGSGALTFRTAIVVAAFFELLGAVALGASVTDSIKAGVIKPEYAALRPDLVMWANLSALLTGTIWLIAASIAGLPVSTTHTIVGCLFGTGMALPGGYEYIDWPYLGTVVASWFISPILCMIFVFGIFGCYRHFILRKDTDTAIKRAKNSLWGTIFLTMSVFGTFFMVKTPLTKSWAKSNIGAAIGCGCAIGFVCMLTITPLFHWFSKRGMAKHADQDEVQEMEAGAKPDPALREADSYKYESRSSSDDEKSEAEPEASKKPLSDPGNLFQDEASDGEDLDCNDKIKKKWYSLPWFMDIKASALAEDLHAAQARDRAEQFHPRTEEYFAYLQIITASLSCIVHGANDVANATAPFSGIYGIYSVNGFAEEVSTQYWILALGGSAIGVGVFFLGHKVIMAMGFKLATITPGRGFCLELGSTLVMVIGSFAGIPLSTTHCKVGGTFAIGMMERSENPRRRNCGGRLNPGALNCRLVVKIVMSWIATLIVGAVMAAALFALGVYSPSVEANFDVVR